jgi:hypothetical protein
MKWSALFAISLAVNLPVIFASLLGFLVQLQEGRGRIHEIDLFDVESNRAEERRRERGETRSPAHETFPLLESTTRRKAV